MGARLGAVVIVGTGFVADLYMRSFRTFPEIAVLGAYDTNPANLNRFATYWSTPAFSDMDQAVASARAHNARFLNLTNPAAHFTVTRTCLEAGLNVYTEKPLAMDLSEAFELSELANEKGLVLASAPCSFMSLTAQTVWKAIDEGKIGAPRLIYAELDDDFIPQAPYEKWSSESGAPWPAEDEFSVGCTLEHAGYYLTWLLAIFGPVERVVAGAANLLPQKFGDGRAGAPDFSTGILYFRSGVVARLPCSIIASHDHRLRIFGDAGVLEVKEAWNNTAPVIVRKRFTLRRKLINAPIGERIRIKGKKPPTVSRFGAASMNFALGPAEILKAVKDHREPYISNAFSLHLTEVTLAIQNSSHETAAYEVKSNFERGERLVWAQSG